MLVWWNCLFTGWSFGNAKNRQRFHEKLLSGFGRWQSRCQITNPSIQPQARKELYEYSGVIWTQRFMSFVAFGLVTQLYIWPRLRILERDDALIPLVVPHTFRFIGLSFLVPGSSLPSYISLGCSCRIRRFGCSHTRGRGHHSTFQTLVLRHLPSVAVQRVGRDRSPICVFTNGCSGSS